MVHRRTCFRYRTCCSTILTRRALRRSRFSRTQIQLAGLAAPVLSRSTRREQLTKSATAAAIRTRLLVPSPIRRPVDFIQADGNPMFETSFNQVINNLTVGTDYSLSFWQAAGQHAWFAGATTEEWKIFFGTG